MIKIIKITGLAFFLLAVFLPVFSFTKIKVQEREYKEVMAKKVEKQNYFALLEINKIDLKREIYAKDKKENDVNQNILLHKNSILPGKKESYVILAAHSGNGQNAYFRNLYQLEVGDEVLFYYNHKKWSYEIFDIEFQDKTGILYLKENYPNMIALITCTKNNSATQTIYYGVLNGSESL